LQKKRKAAHGAMLNMFGVQFATSSTMMAERQLMQS
jgi:hypothetical protein